MRRMLLPLAVLVLLPPAAVAQVKLEPTSATLRVDPHTGMPDGVFKVTLDDNTDPAEVVLSLSTLTAGDAVALARFPASGADRVALDAPALKCRKKASCLVPLVISEAWKSGQYQGTITLAVESAAAPVSQPLVALRAPP